MKRPNMEQVEKVSTAILGVFENIFEGLVIIFGLISAFIIGTFLLICVLVMGIALITHIPMDYAEIDGHLVLQVEKDEGNEPFNQQNWFDVNKTEEIKKLVKQQLLENKTKAEIIALLGKPGVDHFDTDIPRLYYFFSTGLFGGNRLIIKFRENEPNLVYFEIIA